MRPSDDATRLVQVVDADRELDAPAPGVQGDHAGDVHTRTAEPFRELAERTRAVLEGDRDKLITGGPAIFAALGALGHGIETTSASERAAVTATRLAKLEGVKWERSVWVGIAGKMTPKGKITLPVEMDGARILAMKDREIFSAYMPNPKGPVFMTLIQKTFGKDVTTRTWDTVVKVAR